MSIYEIKELFNSDNVEYLLSGNKLYIYEPYKYEQIEIDTEELTLRFNGELIQINEDELSYLIN